MTHNNGRSRSPSGWHEDAIRNRDAGHDEMQAAELLFIQSQAGHPIHRGGKEFFLHGAWIEVPFSLGDRVIGFADVGAQFVTPGESPHIFWIFLEIKPVIGSVGAVVRQVKATEYAASRAGMPGEVWAVVYKDDPKLGLLEEVGDIRVRAVDRPGARS